MPAQSGPGRRSPREILAFPAGRHTLRLSDYPWATRVRTLFAPDSPHKRFSVDVALTVHLYAAFGDVVPLKGAAVVALYEGAE